MISFFNPAVVTIGGVVASAGDIFLTAVRQSIYRRSLPLATRDLEILVANDPDEGVRGAAELVIDELFTPTTMQLWLTAGRPALGSPGIWLRQLKITTTPSRRRRCFSQGSFVQRAQF